MIATGPDGSRPSDVLAGLLSAPLAGAGFDLEEIRVRRAGRRSVVAVAVDRDGGLDLDAVADASRLVSAVLDENDARLPSALRAAYTLEVTSRGADAPLTAPRHWRRALGRLVEVKWRGEEQVVGRVSGADEAGADLVVDSAKPGAKRGGTQAEGPASVRIAYDQVAHARVRLEFSRPAGSDLGDVRSDNHDSGDHDSDDDDQEAPA